MFTLLPLTLSLLLIEAKFLSLDGTIPDWPLSFLTCQYNIILSCRLAEHHVSVAYMWSISYIHISKKIFFLSFFMYFYLFFNYFVETNNKIMLILKWVLPVIRSSFRFLRLRLITNRPHYNRWPIFVTMDKFFHSFKVIFQ